MATLAIKGGTPVREAAFPKWPVWGDEEINGVTEVIKNGKWGSLHGKKVEEFENKFAKYQNAKHGICVTSGTTALKIALVANGVDVCQEVLVPNYTFIASATAVIEAGALPVFVDVEPDTYNIDADILEDQINERTAAIMPVHFAGRPANMDKVLKVAKKHNLKVIEDACQAWGSEWNGKRVGSIGDAGTFSFQSSKNINAGEGGIITCNDALVAKMCRTHANCGRSEDGEWYEHYYFGGNFRMTELQGAVLLAQLGRFEELNKIRNENDDFLTEELAKIEGIDPLVNDKKVTKRSSHIFIFRYSKDAFKGLSKATFLDALRKEGIQCSPGYSLPLNKQPVFVKKAFGPYGKSVDLPVDYENVNTPVTDRAVYDEAIWLTQNVLLGTEEDMDDIVEAISKIKENVDELL